MLLATGECSRANGELYPVTGSTHESIAFQP